MGGFLDALKSVGEAVNPLSAVVNAGTSLVTSALNRHSQKETNKRNAEQNELSREFSAQQAQLDRDFNAAQSERQNAFNAAEAAKSRVFNADQARQQMEFQEKMWNAQNVYNDPSAQIARLKAAGINPNWNDGFDNTAGSVFGGAAATSSPASGSPASHGSVGAPSNIPMSPVTVENPLMMGAQIRLANAQAAKAEAETKTEDATRDGIVKLNQKQYDLWSSQIPVNEANAKFLTSSANKMDAEIGSINKSIEKMSAEISLIDKQGQLIQKDIDSYADRLESQLSEAASRVGLNLANVKQVSSQIALNAALAEQARANAILSGAQAQSLALSNYLDGVKMQFFEDNQEYVLSITEDSVIADWLGSSNARAAAHREKNEIHVDERMLKQMDNNLIAFLRALGSAFNISLGAHTSLRK